MQSDLEAGMPALSSHPLYKDEAQESLQPQGEIPGLQPEATFARQRGLRERQRPSSTTWHLVLVVGDAALLIALFGALLIFHMVAQLSTSALGIREAELIWICLALVSWGLAVNIAQPQNLNYASNRFKGPCCTLFALILMSIFWLTLSYVLLEIEFFTLAELNLLFLGIAIPAFTLWRFLFAEFMSLPRFRRRAVIVGVNSAGETIAKALQSKKHSGTSILGYIAENAQEQSYQGELSILGGRNILRYLAYHNMIDVIIVALEHGTNPGLFKEATDAAQLGISVLPMAVAYENSTGKIPVEHVGGQWYVALQSEQILSPLYFCWKKTLDLICGVFGLLILCLVTPLLGLLITLDSPGPIFYSQERVGFRGKKFQIYKFRSMRPNAEGEGHAVWAAAVDDRITRVGRILRATHLDELPQVFNIVRGDMSLIGPRPERATFIDELEKTVPFYRYRLAVKPGLTGWAQVKYRYGRSDNDALIKLQYDLYYIKKQSFMLDLFIILKTVTEVLSLRGS